MRRLLRYYRQFEGLSEREVNERLRDEATERRAREVARIEPLDLSRTTWPEYPPPAVVNAITYAARRGLHRYLDPHAATLRAELAHHLGVETEQVVVGGGIAQLMGAAAQALLEPEDELVTPWPSYPLYPVIARRSRGHAVPVPGFGPEAVLRAVNDRTRLVALCNPNDPTGELVSAGDLAALLDALPERVVVLLDEALRDFVASEPRDAALELLATHPRLLVFRTFSKAWGLAGLRCGYAVGGPGAEPLLAQLEPELGLNEPAQAGALEALRTAPRIVAGRAGAVAAERARLAAAARAAGLDVAPSEANVLWLAAPGIDGAELARRLERAGVIVAPGGPLGDATRVRLTVPASRDTADRAQRALETAAARQASGA
ncbi:MAG: histidinol-phosphate aminotransferase [Solirubrobacteraceae bacterium]|nr:histidinol-phosphate aminotransferase [Solirubrobacteraceae bacterium]